jgi:hypothetical protein
MVFDNAFKLYVIGPEVIIIFGRPQLRWKYHAIGLELINVFGGNSILSRSVILF